MYFANSLLSTPNISKSAASEDMAEVFSHLMIGTNLDNLDPVLEKKIKFIKKKLLEIDQNFTL